MTRSRLARLIAFVLMSSFFVGSVEALGPCWGNEFATVNSQEVDLDVDHVSIKPFTSNGVSLTAVVAGAKGDGWVAIVDASGTVVDEVRIGTPGSTVNGVPHGSDWLQAVWPVNLVKEDDDTADGGFIVGGRYGARILSSDSPTAWIMWLNRDLTIKWQVAVNTWLRAGVITSVQAVEDPASKAFAGFIVSGWAHGTEHDGFVARLDASGQVLWSKIISGDPAPTSQSYDEVWRVFQSSDGGFVGAGWTNRRVPPSAPPQKPNSDAFAFKLTYDGTLVWMRTYGLNAQGQEEKAFWIKEHTHGTPQYLMAGHTRADGNQLDMWLVNLNVDGTPIWQFSYGTGGNDVAYHVHHIDNGFILSGVFGGGYEEGGLLRLDHLGQPQWATRYEGPGTDKLSIVEPVGIGNELIAAGTRNRAGHGNVFLINVDPDSVYPGKLTSTDTSQFDTSVPTIRTGLTKTVGVPEFFLEDIDFFDAVSATATAVTPVEVTVTALATGC